MNYRFNLDDWLPRFPLAERSGHYRAEIITSPWHLCQNENLRRGMQDQYDWGPAVPMDVFVMAEGEPPDRHVTKIGGLPYWPADVDWPTRPDGTPLMFLGQINFCDSKDLTGDLPGDILLIFADRVYTPEVLGLEWQNLGLSRLIQAGDVPAPPSAYDPQVDFLQRELIKKCKEMASGNPELFKGLPDSLPPPSNVIAPCYGHICRTVSFPHAKRRDPSADYPMCRGKEVWSEHCLPQYQATQIGSAPFFIQLSDPEVISGRVLCTLNSVDPAYDVPFPWINCDAPIPLADYPTDKYLGIGDAGCIYVYTDAAGQLGAHWSCY